MNCSTRARGLTALAAAGGLAAVAPAQPQSDPPTVDLTGVVRDFREYTVEGGHPDFEHAPATGFGRYAGNIVTTLDPDRKPAFSGLGYKISEQWRDNHHRVICPCLYDASFGDIPGSAAQPSTAGITSAATFAQWYRDFPGVNMSNILTITLTRQASGVYVFDSDIDQPYADLGGFFPIDDQLYGNSGGSPDHNYHFTFELHAAFVYDQNKNLNFKFVGSDSVWLFINGHLVSDLEGVHAALDQYVDLERPSLGLVHGNSYPLDFYFAQRYRPDSDFRIQTNIVLSSLPPSTVLSQFD